MSPILSAMSAGASLWYACAWDPPAVLLAAGAVLLALAIKAR